MEFSEVHNLAGGGGGQQHVGGAEGADGLSSPSSSPQEVFDQLGIGARDLAGVAGWLIGRRGGGLSRHDREDVAQEFAAGAVTGTAWVDLGRETARGYVMRCGLNRASWAIGREVRRPRPASLDAPAGREDDGDRLAALVADLRAEPPGRGLEQQDVRRAIGEAMTRLPLRTRLAIWAHVVEGNTLAEVGAELGVSKTWAQQLVARGLAKLRWDLRVRHPGLAPRQHEPGGHDA